MDDVRRVGGWIRESAGSEIPTRHSTAEKCARLLEEGKTLILVPWL